MCLLFQRSYWFGHDNVQSAENADNDTGSTLGLLSGDRGEQFENPMADAKVGIKIRGLTKVL